MRPSRILFVLAGILLLAVFGWNLRGDAQSEEHAVFLRNQYAVKDVVLEPGNYVVVHRQQGSREGSEPCTFFYKAPRRLVGKVRLSEKNEAAKFRCRRSEGKAAAGFILSTTRQPDGSFSLRSVQFPGSSEIHNLTP